MNLEGRLIDFEKNSANFNNAIDSAIFEEVKKGNSQTTLIFTSWRPTVSIGKYQSCDLDVDKEACEKHGVEVVRRESAGQSVYLDDGYIVFSLITKKDINNGLPIRESFAKIVADTLKEFGHKAEFYEPDNVVLNLESGIKTIGNAGQVIGGGRSDNVKMMGHSIVAQASVRYSSPDYYRMLDVLKINGHKLNGYRNDVQEILGSFTDYSDSSKEDIKNRLIQNISQRYGIKFTPGKLSPKEMSILERIYSVDNLEDDSSYKSKGVCYFFVGGNNLLPSTSDIMSYNKPSTDEEALQKGVQNA